MSSISDRLLAEIARDGSTRDSIAAIYHEALRVRLHEFTDWPSVQYALSQRYTRSGLIYIKQQAWKGLPT